MKARPPFFRINMALPAHGVQLFSEEIFHTRKHVGRIEIVNRASITKCSCIGVVCIIPNPNSKSKDLLVSGRGIEVPNADVMFLIDCVSPLGATFNIITEGESYYFIQRNSTLTGYNPDSDDTVTTLRVTKPPKKSINEKLTLLDKQMVTAAIKTWQDGAEE